MAVDVNLTDIMNLEKCLKKVYGDIKVILYMETDENVILQTIERSLPDLFIIEVELGNKDGIALATKIKSKYPGLRIVLTNNSDAYSLNAWDVHPCGYLIKPVTEEKVRKYITIIDYI